MSRIVKITSLVVSVAVVGIIIYYTTIVLIACAETPGIVRKALAGEQIKLKLSDLSKWQLDALLAVEDPAFYRHKGVDHRTPGAGLTTITQSLVKLFYFDHFKPGMAKLKQSLIARFALNSIVSKDDQLK